MRTRPLLALLALFALTLTPDTVDARVMVGGSDWTRMLRRARPLSFDPAAGEFRYYGVNNPGYPRASGTQLEMIPDNRGNAAAVAFHTRPVNGPFAVELDYSVWDDDGGPIWNSADGISVMFGRDERSYQRQQPPTGAARGVIRDGTGYAVHVALYGNDRGLILTDANGRVLAQQRDPSVYTHGRQRSLRVEVDRGVRVYLDGRVAMQYNGRLDLRGSGVAIGAATGGADARHDVRNVRLVSRGGGVAGGAPVPVETSPGGGVELVQNGSFENPGLRDGSFQILPRLPGWDVRGGGGVEVQAGTLGRAADGRQYVELDGNAPTTIRQTLRTRPGQAYELRLWYAARPGTGVDDNHLVVRFGGERVAQVRADGQGRRDIQWVELRVRVVATGRQTQLVLRDRGTANSLGTLVDGVSVRPVGSELPFLAPGEMVGPPPRPTRPPRGRRPPRRGTTRPAR